MMPRILITGGAGFLGKHLCESLLRDGHAVLCVDNFSTGDEASVSHLTTYPGFELLRYDVVSPLDVDIDQIYNLACPASPVAYQQNPISTMRTSVYGAMNMLDLAKRKHARILQASTSEVYGDPLSHPQREDYRGNVNPIGLRACYDEGKRCAETLFFDYGRQFSTKVKVVRIFNTYGPGMALDDGRVISNFIVQALLGEPLTIYGSGLQTRSFCFVTDLVEAMIKMMNSPENFWGPVNLGNPDEITVLDLARLILSITESTSPIVFIASNADDPARRRPDITLAKTELGWLPRTPLRDGLAATIGRFRLALRSR